MGKAVAIKRRSKTRSARPTGARSTVTLARKTPFVRSFGGRATIRVVGMVGTPPRCRAYEEWFSGYAEEPRDYLSRTFEEVAGYDEIVVLRDIAFESHCEHYMAPIIGRAHIGYLPRKRVVGISKLARLVDVYARRFQIQEKMTAEIAACLDNVLKPHGVAVVIEAAHQCMTTRGVHKSTVTMVTSQMLGVFRKRIETRHEFLSQSMRGAAPL